MRLLRYFLIGISILMVSPSMCGQETIRKNSIIVETNYIFSYHFIYNRILAHNSYNFYIGGGYVIGSQFGAGSHWINIEGGMLFFGQKHFLETGPGLLIGLNDVTYPSYKVAYRYQGTKGFVIRPAITIYFPEYPYFAPSIGLGYAF